MMHRLGAEGRGRWVVIRLRQPRPESSVRYAIMPLWFLLVTACGGRQRADQASPNLGPHPGRLEALGQDPAAAVVGTWAVRALNRERVGRRLEIILDSASGRSFRTRVGFLMQGDVGIDPAEFVATPGTVTADGAIRIEIGNRRGAPPGVIVGKVERDTIQVVEFRWGGEDQMAGGTSWVLVRGK